MGAYAAWMSGAFAATARVDLGRTILVSDYEPPPASLTRQFGGSPSVMVLPAEPERPLPGVAYHTFRTNTNPILWDAAVDDAIRAGADTVALLLPPHEVRGRTLLRLRGLGVRRVLLPHGGRLRAYPPWLPALARKFGTLRSSFVRLLTRQDGDAMTEGQCRAILAGAVAPPSTPCRTLRVAHFVASLNSGGAERQACLAAVGQKRDGLDVRVLTRFGLVGDDAHYRYLLDPHGVPVRRVGSRWRPEFPAAWRGRGLAAETLHPLPPDLRCLVADLVGELLTDPVDVLHCYVDDCNVSGLIAGALAGVPAVVVSFRNGHPGRFPGLFRPWMRPWYRAALSRPGVFTSSNSEFGARDYERWLGLPAGSTSVVRNAFEPPTVPSRDAVPRWRRDLGIAPDAPVVAGVFRLQPEKRPLYFLECVDRLRRRMAGLRVVMAGVGDLEPMVRAAIVQRGLGQIVQMLGRRRDVPTILAGSDVLLLTSDCEGTANVLLEAQHCGCVPVATDAGGSREALRPGETGLLVGQSDVEDLVAAVAGLLADPARRRRMAAAGRAFVAEHFSPRTLLEANRRLYRAALGAGRYTDHKGEEKCSAPPRAAWSTA